MTEYLFLLFCLVSDCHGQLGKMINPPHRGSMWRHGYKTPENTEDNQLDCGGLANLRNQKGECGLCGDPVNNVRHHEHGGKYSSGHVGKQFPAGITALESDIKMESKHFGYFEYHLCVKNTTTKATKQCFNHHPLKIMGGSIPSDMKRYNTGKQGPREYRLMIQIPTGTSCSHCVLQWSYVSIDEYGTDDDGWRCFGCGEQRRMRNCADISIGMHTDDSSRMTPTSSPSPKILSLQPNVPTSTPTPTSPKPWWTSLHIIVKRNAQPKANDQMPFLPKRFPSILFNRKTRNKRQIANMMHLNRNKHLEQLGFLRSLPPDSELRRKLSDVLDEIMSKLHKNKSRSFVQAHFEINSMNKSKELVSQHSRHHQNNIVGSHNRNGEQMLYVPTVLQTQSNETIENSNSNRKGSHEMKDSHISEIKVTDFHNNSDNTKLISHKSKVPNEIESPSSSSSSDESGDNQDIDPEDVHNYKEDSRGEVKMKTEIEQSSIEIPKGSSSAPSLATTSEQGKTNDFITTPGENWEHFDIKYRLIPNSIQAAENKYPPNMSENNISNTFTDEIKRSEKGNDTILHEQDKFDSTSLEAFNINDFAIQRIQQSETTTETNFVENNIVQTYQMVKHGKTYIPGQQEDRLQNKGEQPQMSGHQEDVSLLSENQIITSKDKTGQHIHHPKANDMIVFSETKIKAHGQSGNFPNTETSNKAFNSQTMSENNEKTELVLPISDASNMSQLGKSSMLNQLIDFTDFTPLYNSNEYSSTRKPILSSQRMQNVGANPSETVYQVEKTIFSYSPSDVSIRTETQNAALLDGNIPKVDKMVTEKRIGVFVNDHTSSNIRAKEPQMSVGKGPFMLIKANVNHMPTQKVSFIGENNKTSHIIEPNTRLLSNSMTPASSQRLSVSGYGHAFRKTPIDSINNSQHTETTLLANEKKKILKNVEPTFLANEEKESSRNIEAAFWTSEKDKNMLKNNAHSLSYEKEKNSQNIEVTSLFIEKEDTSQTTHATSLSKENEIISQNIGNEDHVLSSEKENISHNIEINVSFVKGNGIQNNEAISLSNINGQNSQKEHQMSLTNTSENKGSNFQKTKSTSMSKKKRKILRKIKSSISKEKRIKSRNNKSLSVSKEMGQSSQNTNSHALTKEKNFRENIYTPLSNENGKDLNKTQRAFVANVEGIDIAKIKEGIYLQNTTNASLSNEKDNGLFSTSEFSMKYQESDNKQNFQTIPIVSFKNLEHGNKTELVNNTKVPMTNTTTKINGHAFRNTPVVSTENEEETVKEEGFQTAAVFSMMYDNDHIEGKTYQIIPVVSIKNGRGVETEHSQSIFAAGSQNKDEGHDVRYSSRDVINVSNNSIHGQKSALGSSHTVPVSSENKINKVEGPADHKEIKGKNISKSSQVKSQKQPIFGVKNYPEILKRLTILFPAQTPKDFSGTNKKIAITKQMTTTTTLNLNSVHPTIVPYISSTVSNKDYENYYFYDVAVSPVKKIQIGKPEHGVDSVHHSISPVKGKDGKTLIGFLSPASSSVKVLPSSLPTNVRIYSASSSVKVLPSALPTNVPTSPTGSSVQFIPSVSPTNVRTFPSSLSNQKITPKIKNTGFVQALSEAFENVQDKRKDQSSGSVSQLIIPNHNLPEKEDNNSLIQRILSVLLKRMANDNVIQHSTTVGKHVFSKTLTPNGIGKTSSQRFASPNHSFHNANIQKSHQNSANLLGNLKRNLLADETAFVSKSAFTQRKDHNNLFVSQNNRHKGFINTQPSQTQFRYQPEITSRYPRIILKGEGRPQRQKMPETNVLKNYPSTKTSSFLGNIGVTGNTKSNRFVMTQLKKLPGLSITKVDTGRLPPLFIRRETVPRKKTVSSKQDFIRQNYFPFSMNEKRIFVHRKIIPNLTVEKRRILDTIAI